MTLTERLRVHIATMAPHHKGRASGWLIIESEKELACLESENAELKSALIRIRDLCQQTCVSFEDQSFRATDIATEVLKKYDKH